MATFGISNNLPLTTTVIDLPFDISSSGRVGYIADTDHKVWKNKVLSLLSIDINERIWYHSFGANINSLLFEGNTEAILSAKAAISEAFVIWAPELTLKDIEAFYDSTLATVSLNIIYQVPTGEVDSVKIVKESLTPAGEIIEVL
jgi:phage baseplate assembly protein W